MTEISDKCIVKNDLDETLGYRCEGCDVITTSPHPISINNWKMKDRGELYCPKCSTKSVL